MPPMRHLVAGLALAAAAACGPNVQPPVKIMALLYSNAGKLQPTETQLDTVANITALKGNVINMVGGGALFIDAEDPAQRGITDQSTDQQVYDAFVKSRGGAVHANLVDKSGVLWPADFHSWAMVTTYWNFEQAYKYYVRAYDGDDVGVRLLEGAEVLYWGDFRIFQAKEPQSVDNMLYFPPTRQFLVTPFRDFQRVPASMNLGIVGHELGHRVWVQKVYGNEVLPTALRQVGRPLNIIRSFDEGIADFHGYGVTCLTVGGPRCATNFLEATFDEETSRRLTPNLPSPKTRDFSRPEFTCMTRDLKSSLELPNADFEGNSGQYKVGTLIAAALFNASEPINMTEVVQKSLITAYTDETSGNPGLKQVFLSGLQTADNVTLERVSDVIIGHMPQGTELQRRVCTELVDRLKLDRTKLTKCPATAMTGMTCPPI